MADDRAGKSALPVVLARYEIKRSTSSAAFARWLAQWRGRHDVRVLVAKDASDVIVVPADAELEPGPDGYLWHPWAPAGHG